MRRKVGDVVSEVARVDSAWQGLVPVLLMCASSQQAEMRESALLIFASVPQIVVNGGSQNGPVLKQVLVSSLQD